MLRTAFRICFLVFGKLGVAAFFLITAAKICLAAVGGAGAAAAHYEIVYVLRFDDVAAKVAPNSVFKCFL